MHVHFEFTTKPRFFSWRSSLHLERGQWYRLPRWKRHVLPSIPIPCISFLVHMFLQLEFQFYYFVISVFQWDTLSIIQYTFKWFSWTSSGVESRFCLVQPQPVVINKNEPLSDYTMPLSVCDVSLQRDYRRTGAKVCNQVNSSVSQFQRHEIILGEKRQRLLSRGQKQNNTHITDNERLEKIWMFSKYCRLNRCRHTKKKNLAS